VTSIFRQKCQLAHFCTEYACHITPQNSQASCENGVKDVICDDTMECLNGDCVDIDECLSPELNICQSFENCINSVPGYTCQFDYDEHCPNENYPVEWKGVCTIGAIRAFSR